MEILPPRRRGQLGSFNAGPGVPGPSGGFTVATPRAQSAAQKFVADATSAPASTSGGTSKVSAMSVSEQVAALQQSTSRAAAASTMVKPNADVFGRNPMVAVQSYSPPAGTPAITLPPKQPNESAAVRDYAAQVPQTQQQVVQQTLARDAGIAVAIPGQSPLVPVAPSMTPAKLDYTVEELDLISAINRFSERPSIKDLNAWFLSRRRGASRSVLLSAIDSVLLNVSNRKNEVRAIMAQWVSGVANIEDGRGRGAIPIGATTASNAPVRVPSIPPPPMSPNRFVAGSRAAAATVGAKIAEQKSTTASVNVDYSRQVLTRIANAASMEKRNVDDAKNNLNLALADLEATKEAALRVIGDQTSSPDAKSQAEAELRAAAEARAQAEKQLLAAQASAQAAADAQAQAAAALKQAQDDAAKLLADAQAKADAAAKAQQDLVKTDTSSQPAATGNGQALTVIPTDAATTDMGLKVFEPPAPEKKPDTGISPMMWLLGLVAVGAVAYALKSKTAGLSGAPTLIEDLD